MNRCLMFATAATIMVASGCSDDDSATRNDEPVDERIAAQVASYDLAADGPQRFLLGVLLNEGGLVVGGTADLTFAYQAPLEGQDPPAGTVEPPEPVTARFLDVAGATPTDADTPQPGVDGQNGVYHADGIEFAAPGFWQVEVTVDLEGAPATTRAAFEVHAEGQIPDVGDRAPRTRNLLPGDSDAPVDAIDSRAEPDGAVPDPELHRLTVADAIESGLPAMVVVSTPVYCLSRFCGPITDTIQALAEEYRGRANFVHIEVWRDYEESTVNRGAADWIYPNPTVEPAEPWVFLIDQEGRIAARWDNVTNQTLLTNALDAVGA